MTEVARAERKIIEERMMNRSGDAVCVYLYLYLYVYVYEKRREEKRVEGGER